MIKGFSKPYKYIIASKIKDDKSVIIRYQKLQNLKLAVKEIDIHKHLKKLIYTPIYTYMYYLKHE